MKVIMDDKQTSKREEALDRALQQIEKAYGKGAIMQLDKMEADVEGLSTGALSLDLALGGKGLPRGRIIELFGPESSGKTTLTLQVIAEAQKQGGTAAFIDAEHALDPSYAEKLGVVTEFQKDKLVAEADRAEQQARYRELESYLFEKLDVIISPLESPTVRGLMRRPRTPTNRAVSSGLARTALACSQSCNHAT